MGENPGSWRHHLLQARLVGAIADLTWRDVDADDLSTVRKGPVLLVANHFGGAADAVVLMSVLPRRPRILADDSIWRYPVARQVMEWLGAIPVHRGHGGGHDNRDMFASTHEALGEGEAVLIFPEGITREEPSIGRVRSGAARIALGARAAGVKGVRVVPVGIHYDDKAALRSAVYVRCGAVIDLDEVVAASATESLSVADLTGLVEQRLREAAPDYTDWDEARALQTASEAYLREMEPTRSVPIGLRDRLAGWLARDDAHGDVQSLAGRYRSALVAHGLTDSWSSEGAGGVRWKNLRTLLTWLVMVPYAIGGVVVHGIPLVLSWLISRLRVGPAVMATILPIAAGVLFGIEAIFWLWMGWRWDTWAGVLVASVLVPVTFAALVSVSERAMLWRRGLRNRMLGPRRSPELLETLRSRTVAAVDERVGASLGSGLLSEGEGGT